MRQVLRSKDRNTKVLNNGADFHGDMYPWKLSLVEFIVT